MQKIIPEVVVSERRSARCAKNRLFSLAAVLSLLILISIVELVT